MLSATDLQRAMNMATMQGVPILDALDRVEAELLAAQTTGDLMTPARDAEGLTRREPE
jgi:hypothetical protein